MIRLQVVNLFAEYEHPEVFAEELYYVEGVCEAGAVFGESAPGNISSYSSAARARVLGFAPMNVGKGQVMVEGKKEEGSTVQRALGQRDIPASRDGRTRHRALLLRPFSFLRLRHLSQPLYSQPHPLLSAIVQVTRHSDSRRRSFGRWRVEEGPERRFH